MSIAIRDDSTTLVGYLQKVYSLLTLAVLSTMGTAYLAVTAGAEAPIKTPHGDMMATPLVRLAVEHPMILGFSFLALCIMALIARKKDGLGAFVLFLFAVCGGVILGPSIAYATFKASQGLTLSANPVRDAGLLTTAAFVGLSAFTLASKKDFSYLGAGLFVGLLVLIGAGLINIFFHSAVFGLAIASATIVVFVGYILFDTSRLIHGDRDDAVGDALNLYLDVLNLFSALLRILGYAKND